MKALRTAEALLDGVTVVSIGLLGKPPKCRKVGMNFLLPSRGLTKDKGI